MRILDNPYPSEESKPFKCQICGCKFVYTQGDWEFSDKLNDFYIKCPNCGKKYKVKLIEQK